MIPTWRQRLADHRNGHHRGRDRSCLLCTIRALLGRTPRPIAPMRAPELLIADEPWHDPTHGRIDRDIQQTVDEMQPRSLGSRVAMENTLQARRDERRS